MNTFFKGAIYLLFTFLLSLGISANAASVALQSPNGGESFISNSIQEIVYSATSISSVTLEYSIDNGSSWNIISGSMPASGTSSWYIPDVSSTQSLVRVLDASAVINPASDVSDSVFTIEKAIINITQTIIASVDSSGNQANGYSDAGEISGNGRFVVFRSSANNLVPFDNNNTADIFVHDLYTGLIERVSVDSFGNEGTNFSINPDISANGRYVVFESNANNLVPGDSSNDTDIFVHDRLTHTTKRINTVPSTVNPNHYSSSPSISNDGDIIAFSSLASNLVVGDTNTVSDIFVYNQNTETLSIVSRDSVGNIGNGNCFRPVVSGDGRYIAFYSDATNLVSGDTNGAADIFVRDLLLATTTRVSVDSSGNQGNGDSRYPSINEDGSMISFLSDSTNLIPSDSNGVSDIFLRNRNSNTTTLISKSESGTQANQGSSHSSISSDGRFVAFSSYAENLVSYDTNASIDIFVRDNQTGEISLASHNTLGLSDDGEKHEPSISSDGSLVSFRSSADKLVLGDTNNSSDIFVSPFVVNQISSDIAITFPNGGEIFQANEASVILYSASNISSVSLEYSSNNGFSWNLITGATPAVGFHNWIIPNVSSNQSLVRVLDASEPASDVSDSVFSIMNSTASITTGLIAHWSFEESGGSIAFDSTGNNHHGSINGIVPNQTGVVGKAYQFDGNSSYVEVPNHGDWDFSGIDYSISLWVKPFSIASNLGTYPISRLQTENGPYWIFEYFQTYSRYYSYDGAPVIQGNYIVSPPAINQWTHYVISVTTSEMKLYENNQLVATKARNGNVTGISNPLYIGKNLNYGPNAGVDGLMDEVRVYRGVALSPTKVNELYDEHDAGAFDKNITVSSPNGGEILQANSSQPIIYSSTNIGSVTLEYSINNGSTWNLIVGGVSATGFHNWNIPNVSSTQSLVRVLDASAVINPASDVSDSVFSIETISSPTTAVITNLTPPHNTDDVLRNTNLSAQYSTAMKTAATTSFFVHGDMSGLREGTFSGGGTNILTFDSQNDFFPGEKISISLTTEAISTTDVNSESTFNWQLTARPNPSTAQFNLSHVIDTETVEFSTPHTFTDVEAGDLDGDGDIDIVASYSGGILRNRFYLNDGTGSFLSNKFYLPNQDNSTAIALGDLDGDSDLDIVVGNLAQQDSIYFNNGSGSFPVNHLFSTTDGNTKDIELGDLDNDGDLDIVISSGNNGPAGGDGNFNKIHYNDGNGNFSTHVNFGNLYDRNNGVALELADFNGDGFLDIVVVTDQAQQNTIHINNGYGNFPTYSFLGVDGGTSTKSVDAEDVDNDNDIDIVIGRNSTRDTEIFYNNGTGNFPTSTKITGFSMAIQDTKLVDIDGDNDVDILETTTSPGVSNRIHFNDGNGNFPTNAIFSTSGLRSSQIAIADFDNDLDLDIVHQKVADFPSVLYNESISQTAPPVFTSIPISSATPEEYYQYNVTATDVDGNNTISLIAQQRPSWASFQDLGNGNGIVSGTPSISSPLSENVWIKANDGQSTVDQFFSVSLSDLNLITPNGGEVWYKNTTEFITYHAPNISNVTLEYSLNNGTSWNLISAATTASGTFAWVIPDVTSTLSLVRIQNASYTISPVTDVSDAVFTLNNEEDVDGISDEIEDNAPNGGDGNNDGTLDKFQANVASLPNASDGQYVTLVVPSSQTIAAVSAVENPSPGDAPAVTFPVGFLQFQILDITPGGSSTVTLFTPAGSLFNTFYKYGQTPGNPTDHWYEFLYDGTTGAVISGNVITLYFVDGLRGDDDLTANGIVEDDGAPASTYTVPTFTLIPPSPGIDCDSVREYTVEISDASAVVGYRVAINFDASKASYVPASADVLGTSAAGDFDSLTVNSSIPGQLVFTNASGGLPLGSGIASLLKFSLYFNTAVDEGEEYTITFLPISQINDDGIESGSVDLVEIVNPINDQPSFTIPNPFLQTIEDASVSWGGFITNINPGSPEESGQLLTFFVETDNPLLFSATPSIDAAGTLNYIPAPNAFGITSATVYLTDNGGVTNCGIDTSTLAFFTIEILSVNDQPSFALGSDQFINEDDPAQTIIGFATNISVGPVNEATESYQFLTSTNNNALFSATPVIDVTGTLTYTPALNANGTALVTVVMKDNGGTINGGIDSSTQTFIIYVFAVNDQPTITPVDNVFLIEDSGVNIVSVSGISDGDPELDQSIFESLSFTNPGLIASASFIVPASSATGTVEIIPALNEFGSSIFTLTVQDSGSNVLPNDNIVSTSFIVNVSPVNDAPFFIQGASQNILNVTGGTRTVTNWASSIIAGPTNEANQLLSFSVDTDQPGLFSVAPAVTPDGTLTFTPAVGTHGIANVSLSLSDDGGTMYGGVNTSATDTYTITSYTQFLWGDLNIDNVSGTVDASLVLRFDAALLPSKTVFGATFQEFPGYPIEQYPEYFQPRTGTLPFPPLSATFPLAFPPAANVAGNDNEAGVLDAAQLLRVAALLDDFVQSDTSFDGVGPDQPIFLAKQVSRSQVIPRSLLVDLTAERSDTVSNAFTAWNMNFFVDNGSDLSGFRIALTYDPTVVDVDEFGVEALSGALIVVNDTQPGRLIVSGALINIPSAGPAELLSVRMVSASSSDMLIDSIRVDVDESLTRLNDGTLQFSAQSVSEVLLSETTDVSEWMIWK